MTIQLPTFLFINGPAGSGKSTLATLVCSSYPKCWRESFAEPIRDMIRTVFFPHEGPIAYTHDLRDGEVKKRQLMDIAGLHPPKTPNYGPTVRQSMIEFSERYMKPHFGQDIFGRLLFKRCQEQSHWYSHFIIDDSGFDMEALYVISQAGPQHCALVRLHRAGCDFAGDSRSYISLPGVKTLDIHNDGEPGEMLSAIATEFGGL